MAKPRRLFPLDRSSTLTVCSLAVLVLVVAAVFSPSLSSDFVYDSRPEILDWDFIHDPGNILTPLTFQIMRLDVVDFNRPVGVASLMFDAMLWGYRPLGYHLTNILLHLATVCLTFALIRQIVARADARRDDLWRNASAALATLLFAIHPVVTEAVCEPSNRKDILAALFGLTAVLLAARHDPKRSNGDLARMVLCPFLCLLAVGSKEVGVAFPVVLFLYWILFRRDEAAKFWIATITGSFAVVVLFLVARFSLAHVPSEVFLDQPTYPGGTLAATALLQARILTLYIINVFWPLNLCADYNIYSLRDISLPVALVVLALVAAGAGWWATRDRRAAFATGFIAAAVLPVCNLVPIYHPLADRFLYVPMIGLALLVGVALDGEWLAKKSSRQLTAALVILVLAGRLVPVTLQRESVWSSQVALMEDTLERNPRSFLGWTGFPDALLMANRLDEAKARTEAALQTPYKTWPWLWFDYALILDRLGDLPGAERAATHALTLKPDLVDTEKMVRTLQCNRAEGEEFARLATQASHDQQGAPAP